MPLHLASIFILFYFTFRSVAETLMVMLGVPFALVGGVWYLVWLEYNMSIAVWVGFIALAGVAAETSAVMLAYPGRGLRRSAERRDSSTPSRTCCTPCTPGRWSASAPWLWLVWPISLG